MAKYLAILIGTCMANMENSCEAALVTWTEALFLPVNKSSENYSKMVRYSGRSINDLGLYYECIKVTDANYVIFEYAESPAIVLGLCLPEVCTLENYWNIIHHNFTSFSRHILHSPLQSPQRTQRNLVGKTIEKIFFPKDFEKSAKDLTPSALGLLFVIGLLGLLSIISTAYEVVLVSERGSNHEFSPSATQRAVMDTDPEKVNYLSFIGGQNSFSNSQAFFLSFSLYSNSQKFLNGQPSNTSSLECLNAVKVLSIAWVCFGHTELFRATNSVVLNIDEVPNFYTHFYYSLISSAPYAVDSFFWVSGFLQGYFMTLYFVSSSSPRFFQILFHRFIRILPLYMFVLLLSWTLAKYIGSGPKWYNADLLMHGDCSEYFWTYPLFINNFVLPSGKNNCLIGSWYLPNDMQFYIISIPIIYLYVKHSRIFGWGLFTVLILFSIVANGTISYDEHFEVNIFTQNNTQYMQDLYYKPYCRVAPYCIGVLGGFIFYSYQTSHNSSIPFDPFSSKIVDTIKEQAKLRWFLYFFGFFLINTAIWSQYSATQSTNSWNRSQNAIFIAVQRTMWASGLNFFFLPMLTGQASILRPFLKSRIWNITAKLVFSVYLTHMVIGQIFFFSQPISFYYTQTNLIKDAVFILVLSFLLAVPLTLVIEQPCKNIEKILLK